MGHQHPLQKESSQAGSTVDEAKKEAPLQFPEKKEL